MADMVRIRCCFEGTCNAKGSLGGPPTKFLNCTAVNSLVNRPAVKCDRMFCSISVKNTLSRLRFSFLCCFSITRISSGWYGSKGQGEREIEKVR